MSEKAKQACQIEDLIKKIKKETGLIAVDNFDQRKQAVNELIIAVQRLNSEKIIELKPPKELISSLLESFVELQSKVQILRADALKLSNDSFDEEQLLNSLGSN